jgi:NarL family two-component system response regulator LiaR
MSDMIKVFITDDHSIVRKGLKAVLETIPDIEVVGEAENGREAVTGVEKSHPDVVLMDLVMPEMDGIEAIQKIKEKQADINILVLTTFAGEDKIFPAIKAGALGSHLKESGPEELVAAIRQVYIGASPHDCAQSTAGDHPPGRETSH